MLDELRFGVLKHACWLILLSFFCPLAVAQSSSLPYQDPSLTVEQRVADLLSRMTLEEKVAQLEGTWQNVAQNPKRMFVDEKRAFVPDRAATFMKYGLGQMSRPSENRGPREMAEFTNTIQKWLKENTRLGIPILFHEECLHGLVAHGATSYPQAIGLAATWDPGLVHEIFTATAAEARSRGAQQCLAPVLDIARDPRWGRTEETYGEDPYLVTKIGLGAITGLQGTGPSIDNAHVFATAKHFAVHGQPEGGTNVAPGNYSERVIREYFLKPFEAAVKEGHVENVMASYNEIDGIPSHSNKHLLEDILRHEWNFDGVTVSDYFGITQLETLHHVAANYDQAARMALDAGVDIELPFADAFINLADQVKAGRISEDTINRSVAQSSALKIPCGIVRSSLR